jgi:hypothetical protein
MKYYTGVGSRSAPKFILDMMYSIAVRLEGEGFILRSGGAKGSDKAFEKGAGENSIIYRAEQSTKEAEEIAKKFHPKWNHLSEYIKKLHGRNAFQVLGINLDDPSYGLICWTPDGCNSHKTRSINTGGTGTAISIADHYGVPINNLNDYETFKKWKNWLDIP